ncbi:MAG: ABC transporter substrate-binding protein [Acetilactobacillus jinshanensis]
MRNVYYNHDGNVDDLDSLILFLEMPNINILGIGAIGADSFVTPAVDASRKLVDYLGKGRKISVAQSNSRPGHQFPKLWRLNAYTFDDFPVLNQHGHIPKAPLAKKPAHLDMIDKIKAANGKVTLVMTGPLSDLARALKVDPSIQDKIEKVYWMGGTMDNQGNVVEPEADGTQEWNSYWDPEAVKVVYNSKLPLVEVGLNSTKQVPLTQKVRDHWASLCKYPAENLIGLGYSMMHLFGKGYYLWDVLTMILSYYPEIAKSKQIKADVITSGPAAGRTYETPKGRPLTLITDVDSKGFYNRIDRLCKNSAK